MSGEYKTCSRCKRELPESCFSTQIDRRNRNPVARLCRHCHECKAEATAAWREKNPMKYEAQKRRAAERQALKRERELNAEAIELTCSVCGDTFYRNGEYGRRARDRARIGLNVCCTSSCTARLANMSKKRTRQRL